MPIKTVVGDVLRTITKMQAFSGSQRNILRVKVMEGDVLRTVAEFVPAMSAGASPLGTITTDKIFDLELVISFPVTAVVTGGLGPFTYAWTIIDGGPLTVSSASFATTTFRNTMNPGQSVSGTARCLITDSVGNQATVDVPIHLTNGG